jgi:hypothetical protein
MNELEQVVQLSLIFQELLLPLHWQVADTLTAKAVGF